MQKREKIFSLLFVAFLASVPVLAISVPRILAYIPALMGLAGFASYYFVYGQKPVWSRSAFLIAGVIIALMFASTLWAIDPAQSLERAQKTSPLLFAGALLLSVALMLKVEHLKPYLRFIPFVIFLTALAICLEISLDYPLYRLIRGYEFNVFVSLAVFNRATVTIAFLLIPALAIMRQFYSAQICLIAVLLTIIPLLMMGESQSAQLALIVAMITYYVFPYKWKYSYAAAGLAIYALMLALPFIAMWAFNYAADIETVPGLGEGGGYAGARMEIWDYVSRYIMKNPLYGFGVEATKQVQNFGSGEIYQRGQTILHPHNYTLQLWMEFGLIGVTLGGALIGWLLLQIGKLPLPQARIALPTLFAVLLVSSTGYGMWQGWWIGLLFIVMVYIILAVRLTAQDQLPMTNT